MFDDTNARSNQTPGFEEWQTIQQPTEKRQNMVGVWWLTPISTRFQLYRWGRTINGRHNYCLTCQNKIVLLEQSMSSVINSYMFIFHQFLNLYILPYL
jgi:hypothetical protein